MIDKIQRVAHKLSNNVEKNFQGQQSQFSNSQ